MAGRSRDASNRAPQNEDFVILKTRLADGLQKAHELALHRDVSPDNIILPDNRVDAPRSSISASPAQPRSAAPPSSAAVAGKHNFVSPEQLGMFSAEVTPVGHLQPWAGAGAALRGEPRYERHASRSSRQAPYRAQARWHRSPRSRIAARHARSGSGRPAALHGGCTGMADRWRPALKTWPQPKLAPPTLFPGPLP